MKAWTDYPLVELGDTPNEEAPIRECEVLAYDGDKYCDVRVDGVVVNFKAGYLYTNPGRLGAVPTVAISLLYRLPRQI
jgi:hypothetical protein